MSKYHFCHFKKCSDWLKVFFQAKIEAIKQDKEATAESMLRTQFKMELLVYSQDRTYSNSLSESKQEDDEEDIPVYTKDNHATLQELMLHLKSYYKVSLLYV